MVVGKTGLLFGTVGGGLIEATALKSASAAMKDNRSTLLQVNMQGEDANAKGMICGGQATLLLDYLSSSSENIELFRTYRSFAEKGKAFYYITVLNRRNELIVEGRSLLTRDGSLSGTYLWSGEQLEWIRSELHNVSSTAILSFDNLEFVVDAVRKTKTVFCFGAGHVAVPTARVASLVGFAVTVIDDRAEFANRERFPEADEIVITADFSRSIADLPIDSESFVVIVTRGHRFDQEVLEQALRTNAAYIGMIGSRHKRDAIYDALLKKGHSRAQMDRIHSPIGVPIGAETPEEIAVSIVAELVAERAKLQE
jgi:xanthine dehydrogenase accessory factor